jgi:hypothetical protein
MRPRRRYELREPLGPVACGECGEVHQESECPQCGEQPDGVWVGVLQTDVVTGAGQRWRVTAHRDRESGRWTPVAREAMPAVWGSGVEEEAR